MAISEDLVRAAYELAGIRLESAGGMTTWEAPFFPQHQKAIFRILSSVRQAVYAGNDGIGGRFCVRNVDIRFPEGSLKCPDISIFCREPDEQDSAVTLLPEAVIEIISKDYEAKDTLIGVPFYVSQGIRDVITFDPVTNRVVHIRGANRTEHDSPIEINLLCGCVCTV